MKTSKLTLASAKSQVKAMNPAWSLTKRDGEYRLSIATGKAGEDSAYYTDDIEDALDTAKFLYKRVCLEALRASLV